MLHRIRAVLVTSVLWALVWASIGAIIGLVTHPAGIDLLPLPPETGINWSRVAGFALEFAVIGAINGALFALLMAVAERGRTVSTLSVGRVTLWAAVGTFILPLIIFLFLFFLRPFGSTSVEILPLLSFLALGAACGLGMIILARRGTRA